MNLRINISMEKDKLNLCGEEIVSLGGSIALVLGRKYCKNDLRKIRLLLQTIAGGILTIEIEERH